MEMQMEMQMEKMRGKKALDRKGMAAGDVGRFVRGWARQSPTSG